jgi:cyclohexyl-isocyanide hydratase
LRWLYHLSRSGASGAERSEGGFVHCSFQPDVRETIALHFPKVEELQVTRIDPRRVADVRVELAPARGKAMPHVYGTITPDAVVSTSDLASIEAAPDPVTRTRFAVVGFARMTLLDLVGVLDPLSRIASMDVDRDASVEVVSATEEAWRGAGARFVAGRVRPALDDFDVLVVAGGPETRALERDAGVIAWLKTFPENRITASVCTGALLLGAAGRLQGKRATTHHASLDQLPRFGVVPSSVPGERVVHDGQLFTSGGVTASLDLGLALVAHVYGDDARARIAARMEYPRAP